MLDIKYLHFRLLNWIIALGLVIWFISSSNYEYIEVIVVCCVIYILYLLGKVSFNPGNPITLFSLIFLLYTLSGFLLGYLDVLDYSSSLKAAVVLHLIALFMFISGGMVQNRNLDISNRFLINTKLSLTALSLVIATICIIYLWYVAQQGFASKSEKALEAGGFVSFGFMYYIAATVAYLVLIRSFNAGRKSSYLLIFFLIIFFFMPIIITGERNIFAKFLIGLLVVHQMHFQKIKWYHLGIIVLLGFLLAPLSGGLKMVLTGNWEFGLEHDLLIQAMYSEFKSSVRNTAIIVDDFGVGLYEPFLQGRILDDISRALLPGFIVGRTIETTTAWFNQNYFPTFYARGGGAGFSQVAYGYINMGIIGVVIWFFLLGRLLKYLYTRALHNEMWLVVYASAVSVACLTIRNDLAAPLSQLAKHVLLVLFVFMSFRAVLVLLKEMK